MDIYPYLLCIFGVILSFLALRAGYWSHIKLVSYILKNHPEKAKEYGCKYCPFINGFKLFYALYSRDNIKDQEFIRLKKKARNSTTQMFMFAILGNLALFLIWFIIVSNK